MAARKVFEVYVDPKNRNRYYVMDFTSPSNSKSFQDQIVKILKDPDLLIENLINYGLAIFLILLILIQGMLYIFWWAKKVPAVYYLRNTPGFIKSRNPDQPEDIQLTAGDGEVILSWSPVEGAAKYCIYRSDDDGSWSSYFSETCTYTDTNIRYGKPLGLKNGQTYTYTVLAVFPDHEPQPSLGFDNKIFNNYFEIALQSAGKNLKSKK